MTAAPFAELRPEALACNGEDPEVMFPANEEDPESPEVKAAKKVCLSCDVRVECLAAALERREPYGVWGALTTLEREALRRRNYRYKAAERERQTMTTTAPEPTLREPENLLELISA